MHSHVTVKSLPVAVKSPQIFVSFSYLFLYFVLLLFVMWFIATFYNRNSSKRLYNKCYFRCMIFRQAIFHRCGDPLALLFQKTGHTCTRKPFCFCVLNTVLKDVKKCGFKHTSKRQRIEPYCITHFTDDQSKFSWLMENVAKSWGNPRSRSHA